MCREDRLTRGEAHEHTSLLDKDTLPQRRPPIKPHGFMQIVGGLACLFFSCFIVLWHLSPLSWHRFYRGQSSRPASNLASSYKQTQFLGFSIYTGGAPAYTTGNASNKVINPECKGKRSYGQVVTDDDFELQCYLGLDSATADIQERLRIMEQAVERAWEASSKDSSILKVFVAPEFYWRGIDGAYAFGDEKVDDSAVCGPVCQVLEGLEKLVSQRQYEDWLFVFGTVVASEVLPTKDPYDYLIYNFAPVYKGYDPNRVTNPKGKKFLLPKRFVSSSDFLTPSRHFNISDYEELFSNLGNHSSRNMVDNPFDQHRKRYDDKIFRNYKLELNNMGYTMLEYDWLVVDNLSVSLEICFDHQMARALQTYMGDLVTGRLTSIPVSSDGGLSFTKIPLHQAQLSIVSSAGMTIVAESLALIHQGVVYLQDGLSNASMRKYWNDQGSCEQGVQFDGGTEALQRRAIVTATDVRFSHSPIGTAESIDVYSATESDWKTNIDGLYTTHRYPPRIVYYNPVDIPSIEVS